MNNRTGSGRFFDKNGVIRPRTNNTRIGSHWSPYDRDTVEIKATMDCVGLG